MLPPPFPSISLIIPCYNVENFIGIALDSALNQTNKFNEIIIVDDGSTDATLYELNRFKNNPSVSIYPLKRNQGQSHARNFGATKAISEFIMFLDSDDYLDTGLVENFRKYYNENPQIDLYSFSMLAFDTNTKAIIDNRSNIYVTEHSGKGQDVLADLILSDNFHSGPWMYIIKKSIINWKKEGFRNIIHEDEEFVPRLFFAANNVFTTPSILYHYRQFRSGSIMYSITYRNLRQLIQSKKGYFVCLVSCINLYFKSLGKGKLNKALIKRLGYFFNLAIIDVIGLPLKFMKRILGKK
jgi:glycosyltransferase involved in cell wall biosynthesis